MARKLIVGYIIVQDEQPITQEGVLALTRRNHVRERRWFRHPDLTQCYVFTEQALRRAITGGREWLSQATTAVPAIYNPSTDSTKQNGPPIPFSALVDQFGQQ